MILTKDRGKKIDDFEIEIFRSITMEIKNKYI